MSKVTSKPADSKIGPPKSMPTRFFLISRLRDEETRKQLELDDSFVRIMSGGRDMEARIKQEYEWLRKSNPIREYLVVSVGDPLDDSIPF